MQMVEEESLYSIEKDNSLIKVRHGLLRSTGHWWLISRGDALVLVGR
jgi:hypothetical protein